MIRVSVCRWGTVKYKQRREPEFEDPKAQRKNQQGCYTNH